MKKAQLTRLLLLLVFFSIFFVSHCYANGNISIKFIKEDGTEVKYNINDLNTLQFEWARVSTVMQVTYKDTLQPIIRLEKVDFMEVNIADSTLIIYLLPRPERDGSNNIVYKLKYLQGIVFYETSRNKMFGHYYTKATLTINGIKGTFYNTSGFSVPGHDEASSDTSTQYCNYDFNLYNDKSPIHSVNFPNSNGCYYCYSADSPAMIWLCKDKGYLYNTSYVCSNETTGIEADTINFIITSIKVNSSTKTTMWENESWRRGTEETSQTIVLKNIPFQVLADKTIIASITDFSIANVSLKYSHNYFFGNTGRHDMNSSELLNYFSDTGTCQITLEIK